MSAPLGGYVLRDTTCTFDGTDYANQLRKVNFKAETPTQTYRTLVPDGIVQDVDTATWTLELEGIQDHVTAQGFCAFLSANAGDQVTVIYTPKPLAPSLTATVIAKAVDFGGTQGDVATFDIELPVIGAPVIA